MKKIYSLILTLLLSAIVVKAQPTLTAANFNMVLGDHLTAHVFTFSSLNPGNAGANQTWNFATTSSTQTNTLDVVLPGSTPAGSQFPNADLAVGFSGNYEYIIANNNLYARNGVYSNGNIGVFYTNDETYVTYPFTYGSTSTDNFSANFYSGVQWYRTGTMNVNADGYGTIILPYGSISNVLRLAYTETWSDVSSLGTFNGQTTGYMWVKPGTHGSIYSMAETTYQGNTSRSGSYLDATSVGVNDIELNDIGISTYPNPCSDVLNVNFIMPKNESATYVVTNTVGQELYNSGEVETAAGSAGTSINVAGWSDGIYFLSIHVGESQVTKKFVVKH